MWIKECQRCHRQFEALGNRAAYCPECNPIHVKERQAKNNKKYESRKRLEKDTKKPVVSLAEQNKKALAAGMTYGQYVAKYGEVEK